jgi:hypothetical protein
MSGLSAQERADGWGRRRFPGEDIKPVLGSRLINIVQIRFLAWVLASIPSGVPNPPPAYPKRLADPGRNYRGRGHHGGGLSELGGHRRARSGRKISNPRRCMMLNNQPFIENKDAGAFAQAIVDTVGNWTSVRSRGYLGNDQTNVERLSCAGDAWSQTVGGVSRDGVLTGWKLWDTILCESARSILRREATRSRSS